MADGDRRTQGLAEQVVWRDLYRADEVYYPNHLVRAPVSGTLWRARVKNRGYAPPALPITTDPVWELYAVNSGIDVVALINQELGGTGWQGGGSGSTNLGIGAHTATTLEVTSDTGADVTLPAATSALAGLLTAANKAKLDGLTWTFTAAETPPATPDPGDIWLDTSIGVLFEYFNDGTSSQWVEWGVGVGASSGLEDGSVTYAKIQNVAGWSVLGRNVSTPGVVAAITATADNQVLRMSGSDFNWGLLTGNSLVDGAIATAKIADQAVTLAKQAHIVTARLLGRATAATGVVEVLDEATVRTILGYLRPDVSSNLTKGMTATEHDNGTVTTGTLTPDPTNGNMQKYTNNGAHTLAPPSATGSYTIVLDVTNGASAGAITTSNWTKVTGDPLTTTNGHKFRFYISKGQAGSHLAVQAMQ